MSSSLSFALLAGKLTLRLTLQPIIDIFAHHILGQAIALLDDSFELLAPSVDRGQIHFSLILPCACFQFPSMRFQSISRLRELNAPQEERRDMPGSSSRWDSSARHDEARVLSIIQC